MPSVSKITSIPKMLRECGGGLECRGWRGILVGWGQRLSQLHKQYPLQGQQRERKRERESVWDKSLQSKLRPTVPISIRMLLYLWLSNWVTSQKKGKRRREIKTMCNQICFTSANLHLNAVQESCHHLKMMNKHTQIINGNLCLLFCRSVEKNVMCWLE